MPDFRNAKLAALYDYWQSKRRDGRLPARADITPFEMQFIIGNLCLIDVLQGEPRRFRMRLLGTNIVATLGGGDQSIKIADWTGGMLDEMPPTRFRSLCGQTFEAAARSGEPVTAFRDAVMDGRTYTYEVAILPLAADGETVDMLLVGLIYGRPEQRAPSLLSA